MELKCKFQVFFHPALHAIEHGVVKVNSNVAFWIKALIAMASVRTERMVFVFINLRYLLRLLTFNPDYCQGL